MENKEVKPLSPSDLKDNLEKNLPKEVIDSVNEILSEKYRGSGSVTFKSKEVIAKISAKMELTKETIYEKKYLDFEPLFRKYGWIVRYEQPCRDENFDAYYEFTPKKD